MEQNNTDEIDLGIVFNKIKQIYTNFLISIYKGIQFLIKHWWKILIVAIIGGVIGYFLEEKIEPNKETTIIVQNNFDSTNYVYDAIEQLNNKIKENDTTFLKEKGFYNAETELIEIKIEPIVSIIELLEKSKDSYKTLEPLLNEIDFVDEPLISDVFIQEYKYHKINLITSSSTSNKIIEKLINYLNNNDLLKNIREIVIKDTKEHIENINKSIVLIDEILKTFPKQNDLNNKLDKNELYVSTINNYTDFAELTTSKNSLNYQKEKLNVSLAEYTNVVTIINKPVLYQSQEIFTNKILFLAGLFVLTYLLFFLLKNFFRRIKQLAVTTN
ncbi:MAG: hypothetical protein ACWA45_00980 [Flavobacteriales bacterium]